MGFVITGQFHNLNDYQVQMHGLQERYVNGQEFVDLAGKWSKSTGTQMDPLAHSHSRWKACCTSRASR